MSKRSLASLPALLTECLRTPSDDGQALALSILTRNGYRADVGTDYVYGAGTIPIMLVAHTDTVHARPPTALYHDPAADVVWSPSGLGADDRAGVYALAALLAEGYRPHILFTDGEERGGIGAHNATEELTAPNVRCLIQLDRAGCDHYVSYSCDSAVMRRYLDAHGLSEQEGTYSDVATLMPAWGIAGANLACGYYGQHSHSEYLSLKQLNGAMARVRRMLTSPPRRRIPYVAAVETWSHWDNLDYIPYRERERRADIEDDVRRKLEDSQERQRRWMIEDDDTLGLSQR